MWFNVFYVCFLKWKNMFLCFFYLQINVFNIYAMDRQTQESSEDRQTFHHGRTGQIRNVAN